MTGLAADLRHALAVYRSTPVASAIAVIALAVGMAFVSAFLSMWSDLSLKPPEGFEADELVTIGQSGGFEVSDNSAPLTLAIVERINETVRSLEFTAGIATFPQVLYRNDTPEAVQAEAVTRHFSDLQPRLLLGRLFDEQDHLAGAPPAVILSHRLWQSQFAGREDVLGETVRITEVGFNPGPLPAGVTLEVPEPRGQDYRIVGVMSPRMAGTFVDTIDLWLPYEQAVPFLYGDPDQGPQRDLGLATAITIGGSPSVPTRMRGLAVPLAGVEAASDELNARLGIEGQAILQGLNITGQEMRFDLIDGVVRDIDIQRESKRQVRLFLAGTLLLVLVAACNISLFLLARASRRQRELGIRMAVGASTKRLARQLTSETGLLMLVATVLGVFISLWLAAALREMPFLQQAEWRDVSPFDWRVLGLLSAIMLLLTLLVSLAPIFGLRRAGIRASSGMVTARASWGQRLAGTTQIALTGIVAAVAVAFAWHLVFYSTADRGFDPEDVLVVELLPSPSFMVEAPTQTSIAIERERQRDVVTRLPGVRDASFATYAPGGAGTLPYTVAQVRPGVFFEIGTIYIDDHYFDVLSMPLLYGQNIDPYDFTQLVANESYAVNRFGAVDAIGETTPTNRTLRGVVRDVSFGHPAEAVPLAGFIANAITSYPLLLVKTSVTPARMRTLLQDEIDAGELEIELGDIDRLENIVNGHLRADRARVILTAGSALLVVILSALGFYGTQRYLVTAGQREYAIRSAIGAGPRALSRLVLSRGIGLGLPGLIFGGVLALLVVAWLRDGFLVSAVSPASVSAMSVVMIIALVLAASLGPALQARKTAPAALLRED
jgi:ABC-type antimicrobial peptide transport system permease subunit